MTFSPARRFLHAFAAFTTVLTFVLLISGGLVTSHGAGLAVPDWPNSYGYNMFLFPISKWVGGIFYEHTHRLIASGIGLLTVLLAVAIFIVEKRGWVKVLAGISIVAVILQGVLGGLRVTLKMDEIGIFHGILAQSFFVLLGVITVSTSRGFLDRTWAPAGDTSSVRKLAFVLVGMVFVQLGLAASMRHAHMGLSIPDFPLAYGRILPDTSPAAMQEINARRVEAEKTPTTAAQIWVQMAHRGMAALIALATFLLASRCVRLDAVPRGVRSTVVLLACMIVVQIGLGAWTIWSDKAADVTTAHHAVGALFIFISTRLAFRLAVMGMSRVSKPADAPPHPDLVSA